MAMDPRERVESGARACAVVLGFQAHAHDRSGVKIGEPERKQIFEQCIRSIVEAINDDEALVAERKEIIYAVHGLTLNDQSRTDCESEIERAVTAHMDKLRAAHEAVFPDLEPFSDDMLMRVSQRDMLVKELERVFFDGADPGKFHHPYNPPGPGNVIFVTWWRSNVAGHDPTSRAMRELLVELEKSQASTNT